MLRDREVVNYCRLSNSGIRMFAALFIAALLFLWPGAGEAQTVQIGIFSNISSSLTTARTKQTSTLLNNGKVLVVGGIDSSSNAVTTAVVFDPATGKYTDVSGGLTPRGIHTATLLTNGKVLLVGGKNGASTLSSIQLFDPSDLTLGPLGSFSTPAAALTTGRYGHTATLLGDGRVLIAGGYDAAGNALGSTELFDPSANACVPGPAMGSLRAGHTATLITQGSNAGKVLLAGGFSATAPPPAITAELYTPSTAPAAGSISATGSMTVARFEHTATALPNGDILIVGGKNGPSIYTPVSSAEIFSSSGGAFTATSSMTISRAGHSATLLPDGMVLIYGSGADIFDPASGLFISLTTSDKLAGIRFYHTATLLPDSRVMIVGGDNGEVPLATGGYFTPGGGSFTQVSPAQLPTNLTNHTTTLLPDGRVLIAGGSNGTAPQQVSYVYDPANLSTPYQTFNLNVARESHTATLLANGKVLIAGGFTTAASTNATNSAELFDPALNSSAPLTSTMASSRARHRATLLADGRVLLSGGTGPSTVDALTTSGDDTLEIFNPASGTFTRVDTGPSIPLLLSQGVYSQSATLLPNGQVLIAGGEYIANAITSTTSRAYLFNPVPPFTGASLSELYPPDGMGAAMNRSRHTATLLPSGRVLIAGGYDGAISISASLVFDPVSGLFSSTLNLLPPVATNSGRYDHTATLLSSGRVLIAGGTNVGQGQLSTGVLYDPETNQFLSNQPAMVNAQSQHSATLMPDASVLLVGGLDAAFAPSFILQGFDEGFGYVSDPSRRPIIAPNGFTMLAGSPPKGNVVGALFTGNSEGSSGGSNSSATNYPLLRFQRVDNDQVYFPAADPASNWSATSFTAAPFTMSPPVGYYRASIITNGIPSVASLVSFAPFAQASPSSLTFTASGVGAATVAQSVIISNAGATPLAISSIGISGTGATSFSVTPATLSPIPSGGTASLSITYTPATAGPHSASLEIATNDPGTPNKIVTLSGSITPPPSTTTISGQVTDGGGAVLQNIPVLAYNASTDAFVSQAVTDASGNYTISGLPDGSYKVLFLSATFARQYYNGKFDVVNATPVAATIAAPATGINAVLTAGGSISGRVTDPSGAGLGSVVVYPFLMSGTTASFVGMGVTTDTTGNYAISNLPPGSYKIQFFASASLMGFYNGKQDLASADPVTVAASTVTSLGDSVLQPAVPPGPRTVSGSISFSGTDRAYIVVGEEFGTSVPAGSSTFTINGVPPGIFPIYAFVDSHGTGTPHLSDPLYMWQVDTTSGSATITITPEVPTAPSLTPTPGSIKVTPGNGGAFVRWDTPRDKSFYRAEVADSYTVYWSTSPHPGPGSTVGGNSTSVTANDEGHLMIPGLVNGSDYYFSVTATYGTLESAPSPVIGPVRIGSTPAAGVTVSGTISLSGITANGPLYVILEDWKKQTYGTAVASPTSSQAFSIPGVPDGAYRLYAFIDQNNNQVIDLGDPRTAGDSKTVVTVSGAAVTGVAASLSSAGAIASVTTNHHKSGSSDWYELNFDVYENVKRPVTATLQSSTSFAGPIDLGNSDGNRFHVWTNVPSAPVGNEIYTILVTYGDGASETLSAAVTGVLNDFAVPTGPASGATVTDGLSFTWSAPTPAPAYPFAYKLELFSNSSSSGKMRWDTDSFIPSSLTTVPYNYDFKGPVAISNGGYNWTVTVQDVNGNRASVETPFTLSITTAPTITAISPAAGATNVALNGEFKTTFSREMDPSSLSGAITTSTGTVVKGFTSYDPFTKTALLQPSAPLSSGTTYTATLTTAKDIVGNSVSGLPLTMSFTTSTANLPSGDLNGDGKVDMADALQALKIAVGLVPQATGYKVDGDVAPLVNGKPAAARKGYITVGDAIVILEKTLNIVSW